MVLVSFKPKEFAWTPCCSEQGIKRLGYGKVPSYFHTQFQENGQFVTKLIMEEQNTQP